MRFVYQVFCIVGWSWAVVVAVALGVLSRRRPDSSNPPPRGFEVAPPLDAANVSRAARPAGDALAAQSLKEA